MQSRLKFILVGLLPTLVGSLLLLTTSYVWLVFVSYHFLCLGIPTILRCYPKQAGLVLANPRRWLPITVVSVLILAIAAFLVVQISIFKTLLPSGWQTVSGRIHSWAWFVVYSLVINAFSEEYFWRGFLVPRIGIFPSAFGFWLLHFTALAILFNPPSAILMTLPIFGAAVFWGWLRQKFESLWPCVITHIAADGAILWIMSLWK
ncbi:MAG TPA: CPBP family intramembrane glutamic endopeptidase [Acidobacteriota bacterium]|nr:CPBP family intramembrane glutamic endopeptidase [Acidobacteriota bacterium]